MITVTKLNSQAELIGAAKHNAPLFQANSGAAELKLKATLDSKSESIDGILSLKVKNTSNNSYVVNHEASGTLATPGVNPLALDGEIVGGVANTLAVANKVLSGALAAGNYEVELSFYGNLGLNCSMELEVKQNEVVLAQLKAVGSDGAGAKLVLPITVA